VLIERISFTVSDHVADEANRLLEQGLVRLCMTEQIPGAVVIGRHADYTVWFLAEGVTCDCRAGADHGATEPRCSHAVAAMICWADALAGRPWAPNRFLG
jgi:hypothetical protein